MDPTEVGLAPGPRRRTPGLRREEVAQLSGVSLTWYSWLEQQRDITVSRQVIDSLARTLRLTPPERRHLFALTGQHLPPELPVRPALGATLRRFVHDLAPQPAYVIDQCWDLLAWNDGYANLVGGLDHLAPEERNSIWLLFTRAELRTVICDWPEDARRLVGQFRAVAGQHADHPRIRSLVGALLSVSPDFEELWRGHPIEAFSPSRKQFQHPLVGTLTVDYLKLAPPETPEVHLVTYLPADTDTEMRFRELAARTDELPVAASNASSTSSP